MIYNNPLTPTTTLIGLFLLLNLLTFTLTAYDKRKARRNQNHKRTPEGLIFFWAAIFGATGVYFAMHLFRHKTRKWYFQIGIPLLILQNTATFYVLWDLFT